MKESTKKRKIFSFSLIFTLILTLFISPLLIPIKANADVIVEPNNRFYERNRDKMQYMGRRFYANGETGYITLLVEPNSAREVISFRNGEIINIMFTYDDNGVVWGITELYAPDLAYEDIPNGWVLMSQLYVVYDSAAFIDENTDSITEQEFDLSSFNIEGDMVFWTWPGSGVTSGTFKEMSFVESNMNVGYTMYIDNEGRQWAYLPYFYGWREVWVCLDDPANLNIPAFNPAPEPQLRAASQPPDTSSNSSRLSTPMFAVTLVSLVAMLSLVLIQMFWRKKTTDKK